MAGLIFLFQNGGVSPPVEPTLPRIGGIFWPGLREYQGEFERKKKGKKRRILRKKDVSETLNKAFKKVSPDSLEVERELILNSIYSDKLKVRELEKTISILERFLEIQAESKREERAKELGKEILYSIYEKLKAKEEDDDFEILSTALMFLL